MPRAIPWSHRFGSRRQEHPLFERQMNGYSRSLLLRDDLGSWVVKPWYGPACSRTLMNEYLGVRLLKALELPTPDWRIVKVPAQFFKDRSDQLDMKADAIAPGAVHFASRFLPDQQPGEFVEILPFGMEHLVVNRPECLGILLFDSWALHADVRQAIFGQAQGGLKATFIDNGHLFGGPEWKNRRPSLHASTIARVALGSADRMQVEFWLERMLERLPGALTTAIQEAPKAWRTEDLLALSFRLRQRLRALRFHTSEALTALKARESASTSLTPKGTARISFIEPSGKHRWEHYSEPFEGSADRTWETDVKETPVIERDSPDGTSEGLDKARSPGQSDRKDKHMLTWQERLEDALANERELLTHYADGSLRRFENGVEVPFVAQTNHPPSQPPTE